MSEPTRLWLNWETFEVGIVNQLFTSDISIQSIQEFASHFPNFFTPISYEQWKQTGSSIFRLQDNQLLLLYSFVSQLLVTNPLDSLLQSGLVLANNLQPSSESVTVADMLVYLFAIFVKKKCRSVSELSQIEAFPAKAQNHHVSPRDSRLSASTPTVARNLLVQAPKNESSQYQLMLRFFILRLPQFFAIYAPDGMLTASHIQSLSLLVQGGPSYSYRAPSLNYFLNLFAESPKVPTTRILRLIQTSIPLPKEAEVFASRYEIVQCSPFNYRPFLLGARPNQEESGEGLIHDSPVEIKDVCNDYKLLTPESAQSTLIYNCRHTTVYICGPVSSLYIANCKDSTIFVGSALAVHMELCSNVTLIAATRLFHIDASTRCTLHLLVNTPPLVTGNSSRLVFAPYNAQYARFGLDILCIGVNPTLNYWNKPTILGALGRVFELMQPARFNLLFVPFTWPEQNSILSAPIPPEYEVALEQKRTTLMNLKSDLMRIRSKDPDLYDKLVDQIKSKASKWIQESGKLQEMNFLFSIQNDSA